MLFGPIVWDVFWCIVGDARISIEVFLLAMELGACDVVLGVDWMRKFPIISISLSVGCN